MKRMKRIWIASGISVVILATTTVAWIKIRNTNDFIPGVNAREMQMNQIVFPDKRNTAASKKSKKEADNWKEKDKANEKLHPEDFTDIPSQAELQNQYNKNQNETNSLAQILATDNSYALNGNINSLVTGQIVSSANGNGDYIGNIYIPSIDGSGSLIHLPGDSDSNTSASGANGSSSGNNNTTPDSYPSNGINPSGSHTSGNGGSNTSSTPSSGGNSGNNGGNSSINKPSGDNNTSGQPDSVPSLPGSLIQPDGNFDPNKWNNTVGDDTPITGDPSVDPTKVQCMVTASMSQDSSKENSLYYGQPLTDWNIFCAVCAYWRVDNKFYRINSFNDYFKIGSHPDVATEDFVQTFYYRPTRKSDWIPIEVTIPVYQRKLLIEGGVGNPSNFYFNTYIDVAYPEENQDIDMLSYYVHMMPVDYFWPTPVTELFLGWSETIGGTPVGYHYQMKEQGRKVLYPLQKVPVPSGFSVQTEYDWTFGICLQTLVDTITDSQTDRLPEGIQKIAVSGEVDELYIPRSVLSIDFSNLRVRKAFHVTEGNETFAVQDNCLFSQDMTTLYAFPADQEEVYVPATVSQINTNIALPEKGFNVDPDNPYYTSVDGILYNKDQTTIYAIPAQTTTLTVPETVTDIALSYQNKLTEIHLSSAEVPYMDLWALSDVTIYVPANNYLDYYVAWIDHINHINLKIEDTTDTPDYIMQNDALLSADGKILYRILNNQSTNYIVPNGVEIIKDDAAASAWALRTVYLPTSIKTIEENAFAFSNISDIYFLGDTPPTISQNTFAGFGEGSLHLSADQYDAYLSAWEPILGKENIETLLSVGSSNLEEQDGFIYLNEPDGATIIHAPQQLASFDETTLPGVTIKAIGDFAFANCPYLTEVVLPASVKEIGQSSFANCPALEGFLSESTDKMTIGENAFDSSNYLRFIALNATDLVFENDYMPMPTIYGSPQVNYYFVNRISNHYYLDKTANATLLYCDLTDDEGNFASRAILRATSTLAGELHLLDQTTSIAFDTFNDCHNPFTLVSDQWDRIDTIGDNAFNSSGIEGSLALPKSLSYLGENAFAQCENLSSIFIDGRNLSKIPNYVFAYCANLTEITFGENCAIDSIGIGAFGGTAISEIDIPASVTQLNTLIFSDCYQLSDIHFHSETPPTLNCYLTGQKFQFVSNGYPIHITVSDESYLESYINAWYGPIAGTTNPEDLLTEEKLEAINIVRGYFGLEPLSDLDGPSETYDGDTEDTTALDPSSSNETDPEPDSSESTEDSHPLNEENTPSNDASSEEANHGVLPNDIEEIQDTASEEEIQDTSSQATDDQEMSETNEVNSSAPSANTEPQQEVTDK